MILSISVPVLNAIYPVSIVLIVLGLSNKLWKNNRYTYPLTIYGTAVVSVLYALENTGIEIAILANLIKQLPLYEEGFGWLSVTLVMLVISIVLNVIKPKSNIAK